jgi:putative ABC transport system permease protein
MFSLSPMNDLKFAFRQLLKNPGFTVVAVLTLALGIGATTAIFSVVNAVVFLRLPFSEADRLVLVAEANARGQGDGASPANFLDWKEQSHFLKDISAKVDWSGYELTGDPEPEQVIGVPVSAGMFRLLKVQPLLGRVFSPEEDQPGGPAVVLLSHHLWQRRFNGDPGVIGRSVAVNGTMRSIVGVMPARFYLNRDAATLPESDQLWIPLAQELGAQGMSRRNTQNLRVWARLQPGISLAEAQAEMGIIQDRLAQQSQSADDRRGIKIIPLREWRVQKLSRVHGLLGILLGAVAFVMLIACANVANLQLARTFGRTREMAIRLALGAGRFRVVRQLLTESVLLAVIGASVGMLIASWGIGVLSALIPETIGIPRIDQLVIDQRVFAFTSLTSILAGVMFGLAPALQALRTNVQDSLKENSRGTTTGLRGRRFGGVLVILQVALSLVLLVGAGLLVRSFLGLLRVDPGINTRNVLTLRIPAPDRPENVDPADLQKREAFVNELLQRLPALPGVNAVGVIDSLPLTGGSRSYDFAIEGQPPPGSARAVMHIVSDGYFQTMAIPIKRGHGFTNQDVRGGLPVALVNETAAARFWPGENPIGKRVKQTGPDGLDLWFTVIGVVGDVRDSQLGSEPKPEVYGSSLQLGTESLRTTVVLRTHSDPSLLVAAIRRDISAIDPKQPVAHIQTMEQVLGGAVAPQRFNMTMILLLACIALLLSSAGIYAVIAYAVAQRTHEIGIRIALGAQTRDVLSLIIGQGIGFVTLGVVIGVLGACALTRVMQSLLFGVNATDPLTLSTVSLLLVLVALLACWLPARHAAKVDPMEALRYE